MRYGSDILDLHTWYVIIIVIIGSFAKRPAHHDHWKYSRFHGLLKIISTLKICIRNKVLSVWRWPMWHVKHHPLSFFNADTQTLKRSADIYINKKKTKVYEKKYCIFTFALSITFALQETSARGLNDTIVSLKTFNIPQMQDSLDTSDLLHAGNRRNRSTTCGAMGLFK